MSTSQSKFATNRSERSPSHSPSLFLSLCVVGESGKREEPRGERRPGEAGLLDRCGSRNAVTALHDPRPPHQLIAAAARTVLPHAAAPQPLPRTPAAAWLLPNTHQQADLSPNKPTPLLTSRLNNAPLTHQPHYSGSAQPSMPVSLRRIAACRPSPGVDLRHM